MTTEPRVDETRHTGGSCPFPNAADVDAPRARTRRAFIGGTSVAAVGVAGGAMLSGCARADSGEDAAAHAAEAAAESPIAIGEAQIPFHGERQAGIATPPQAHCVFRAFDLAGAPDNRRDYAGTPRLGGEDARRFAAALKGVLRVWTDDGARLAEGKAGLADMDPELAENPARLTLTVGFGPRLFDLIGLPELRPEWLRQMPAFEIDDLDDRWNGGDLLLHIAADDPLTVANASRLLSSGVRGLVTPRWAQQGFRKAAGAHPSDMTQRNLFGQLDGTVQPDAGGDLVFCGDSEPQEWMRGGSGLVLRRITMNLDTWEEVDPPQRDLSLGRRQSTGAPLTGTHELDPVDLEAMDSAGLEVIPPQSHVARAHARSQEELFLRRPFNFVSDDGGGDPESGLLFAAYCADIGRQFLPVQKRLAEADLLNTWTTPTGSAAFALPPGLTADQAKEGRFLGDGVFK